MQRELCLGQLSPAAVCFPASSPYPPTLLSPPLPVASQQLHWKSIWVSQKPVCGPEKMWCCAEWTAAFQGLRTLRSGPAPSQLLQGEKVRVTQMRPSWHSIPAAPGSLRERPYYSKGQMMHHLIPSPSLSGLPAHLRQSGTGRVRGSDFWHLDNLVALQAPSAPAECSEGTTVAQDSRPRFTSFPEMPHGMGTSLPACLPASDFCVLIIGLSSWVLVWGNLSGKL